MSVTNEFTSLFEAIEQQPDHSTSVASLVALLSSSKDRNHFLAVIKSSSFHKNHARRLFGALLEIISAIVQKEEFVPANAFQDHEGVDERRNSSQGTKDSHNMDKSDRLSSVSSMPPVTPDEKSTRALHFMKYTAMMVQSYLANILSRRILKEPTSRVRKPNDVMDEVKEITGILHSSLFELNSCGKEGIVVQKSIISLCEAYWNGNFVDRNDYVTSLIPLLVLRTLDGNATKADIKRLWDMKEALHLISFQDESVVFLRSLLLRTVTSLLYVKNVEGRKMIAHLFQLDTSLVKDLHTAIKAQIPMATKTVLPLYGDIYWRAWREASQTNDENNDNGDNDRTFQEDQSRDVSDDDLKSIKDSIEDVLQELMNASVHVVSPHMAKSLRSILDPFHAQKKNPEVDLLLYELYTPFLWRSLSAANPMVRVNASSILARTFPLRNPNMGSIHLKEVNDKTVESLLNLLNDDDHKARVAGCNATVQILATTWDALSTKDIRILLNIIITKHAKDASSSAVRAQAINGISQLLDAPETHGVLKPLLPFLGDLIHDRVERVRLATVKLLLKLKKTKGFKYYHTVPSSHLLARLAAEGEVNKSAVGPVASALTELLSNSFFPLNAKPSEQMRRTLSFLDNDPKAARVFYANIGYQLEIRSVSKLIVLFLKTLKLAVARDVKDVDVHGPEVNLVEDEAGDDCADPHGEEADSAVDVVVSSNTRLMFEIAHNMLTLLTSISNDLEDPENEGCLHFIQQEIRSDSILDLCNHFQTKAGVGDPDTSLKIDCQRICSSLLSCSRFVHVDDRNGLRRDCLNRLEAYSKLPSTERNTMEITPYLSVFCFWNTSRDMAQSLSQSISSLFKKDDEIVFAPVSGMLRSGKRKQFDISENETATDCIPKLPGDLCIQIIANVLRGSDPCSLLIRDALVSCEESTTMLTNALEKATIAAEEIISRTASFDCYETNYIELVLSACEAFGRLSIHKEAYKNNTLLDLSPQAKSLLRWLSKRALPLITSKLSSTDNSSPFKSLNLSRISAIGTRESASPIPLSPLILQPPRRRSYVSTTPSKVDSSFVSMERQGGRYVVHSDFGTTQKALALVIVILQSAFALFGDWLKVGGQGGDDIISHVKEWTQMFDYKVGGVDVKLVLLPSYCRFVAITARICSDVSLMDVLFNLDFSESENGIESCLEDAFRYIFSSKTTRDHNLTDIVQILATNLCSYENQDEFSNLERFLDGQNTAVKAMLRTVMSSNIGLLTLAEMLSQKIAENDTQVCFIHAKLLLLLLDHYKDQQSTFGELKQCVIRHLSSSKNETESIQSIRDVIMDEVMS